MRMWIASISCLLATSGVARATYDDPKTAAKWGLSDDQSADEMVSVVQARIKKMIGKDVKIELVDTEGKSGKCHDDKVFIRSDWRKKFTHLLSAMQFMSEDAIGKATVKKIFKGFRWVCYNNSAHDNVEFKDGFVIVTGNPMFLAFTGEGAYGRRRYHQFKEETLRFGDEDVGDTIYDIYDDDSTGTSISYERAARYARDVIIPTYNKRFSELLGGPIEIEIDFDHARCIEHENASCGNPFDQQDTLLIKLFDESAGIPGMLRGLKKDLDDYADDHDPPKIAASKKALVKQIKKIRFSWRAHGDEDGNGRVDFKLDNGVLTVLPGWKTNYIQDQNAVRDYLKSKVSGFLP